MNIELQDLPKILKSGIKAPFYHFRDIGKLDRTKPVIETPYDHQGSAQNSIFISTTRDRKTAVQGALGKFTLQSPKNGVPILFRVKTVKDRSIDFQKLPEDPNKYHSKKFYTSQKEIAILGEIPPSYILGYWKLDKDGAIGEYVSLKK